MREKERVVCFHKGRSNYEREKERKREREKERKRQSSLLQQKICFHITF